MSHSTRSGRVVGFATPPCGCFRPSSAASLVTHCLLFRDKGLSASLFARPAPAGPPDGADAADVVRQQAASACQWPGVVKRGAQGQARRAQVQVCMRRPRFHPPSRRATIGAWWLAPTREWLSVWCHTSTRSFASARIACAHRWASCKSLKAARQEPGCRRAGLGELWRLDALSARCPGTSLRQRRGLSVDTANSFRLSPSQGPRAISSRIRAQSRRRGLLQ